MLMAGRYPTREAICSTAAKETKRLKLMRYLSSLIAATDEESASTRNLRRRNRAYYEIDMIHASSPISLI